MVHIPSSLLKFLLALVAFVFSVAGHPTASDVAVTVAVDLLLCIIPWHRKNLPVMYRLWPSLTLTKLTSMTTNPPCSHNPPLHSGTCHSNVPWRCPGVSSTALHVAPWNLCPLPISQKKLQALVLMLPTNVQKPGSGIKVRKPGLHPVGWSSAFRFFLPCVFL